MDSFTQPIQLLSQSPGNIVYHLVTLFALQAVFGIAISQWRRNRNNTLAFRFAMSALFIILGRFVLLLLVLGATVLPWTTAVLPLLEQALNTATIFALLWAIVPSPDSLPRLSDLVFLIGILIVGAMTVSFFPGWQAAAAVDFPYNDTNQDTVWTILQMSLLTFGGITVLLNSTWRKTLSPAIIFVLLGTALAHLFEFPAFPADFGNVATMIRLGHFVAFPIWVVMTYQQLLVPLFPTTQSDTPTAVLTKLLKQAGHTITAESGNDQLSLIIQLAESLLNASFVGVATQDPMDASQLLLISNQPQANSNAPRTWLLKLNEWPSLQVPMNQRRPLEINMSTAGAGQLHRFAEKLTLGELETLLVQPITHQQNTMGVLVIGERSKNSFSEEARAIADALAEFSGELLAAPAQKVPVTPPVPQEQQHPPLSPESNEVISGRVITLEQERDRLAEKLQTANNKLKQAEKRAIEAVQRSQDLAASLEMMEKEHASGLDPAVQEKLTTLEQDRVGLLEKLEEVNGRLLQSETKLVEMQKQNQLGLQKQPHPKNKRVKQLERENDTLRESLEEAEEAMAMAAAGQSDISTEWVMLTITRYSGELEQAQAKIEQLEQELAKRNPLAMNEILISVIQELRTPMTSIAGFTDLLLGGSLGNLGVKQRDLLQRIQANTDRMGGLLNQIMLLTPENQKKTPEAAAEKIDVREAVETAVTSVMSQIREKRIHLDLDIAQDLPAMTIKRNVFHQIVTNLLDNACLASGTDGNIAVTVYPRELNRSDVQQDQPLTFIELTIKDSGDGISTEDLANVFSAHYNPEEPLIAGLGDTTAGLSMAHNLTIASGGRLWVDSEKGKGSIFSLLFPLTPNKKITSNGSITATS